MNNRRNYLILGAIGLLMLTLSSIIHIMTYFFIEFYDAYALIGIFILFFLYILLALLSGNIGLRIRFSEDDTKYSNHLIFSAEKVLGIYCLLNFGLCMYLMEFGTPDIWNGVYVLQNKGALIRNITEIEYSRFKAYEMRLFTAFHVVAFMHLLWLISGLLNKKELLEKNID